MVSCFCKGVPLNHAYFPVHSILPADNIGKEVWYPVITRRSVIVKMNEIVSSQTGQFILQLAYEDCIQCFLSRLGPELMFVDITFVAGMMQERIKL